MKKLRFSVAMLAVLAVGILTGCSETSPKSPDVSDSIRKSLDQAGSKDVTVGQSRQGHRDHRRTSGQRQRQVTSRIPCESPRGRPGCRESDCRGSQRRRKEAKAVNSDLDKGIEKNLDAALIQNRMHDNVKYDVKSGVVTLTGEVNSQAKRDRAEKVATNVPNVKQVVNDLQVKNQKASSSQ
jgi:osmotically-inducible protein OsmY